MFTASGVATTRSAKPSPLTSASATSLGEICAATRGAISNGVNAMLGVSNPFEVHGHESAVHAVKLPRPSPGQYFTPRKVRPSTFCVLVMNAKSPRPSPFRSTSEAARPPSGQSNEETVSGDGPEHERKNGD